MKIKFNSILIITGLIIAMYNATLLAQNTSKPALTTIESVVMDENGDPVAGAIVRGNEGAAFARTDIMGRFTIAVSPKSLLLIESQGYEPAIFAPFQYTDVAQLQLTLSPLMEGSRDTVQIAFNKTTQKRLVNAVSVINPDEIREYDNINSLGQALAGRVAGMYSGNNLRGIGEPLYVVDGLPRSIDNLSLAEIESISVLKDINSAVLYGSQARNGVILITTKRGEAHKKDMKITAYYGINTPQALPKYLSSAEYMELNNEARVNDGYAPNYNEDMIENYRYGNLYRYPSVDYYTSDYMNQIKPFWKTMMELTGGNDKARYYLNAGWEHIGNYLNFGEGKRSNENKFNVRGNVDMELASWITTSLDASAFFKNTWHPRGTNFWQEAATRHPHTISPLIPINLINDEDAALLARKNDVNGIYILGGDAQNLTNAIASTYFAGHVERSERLFTFNNRVNFDLDRVLEGLSFHTNISFDYYTIYDQAIQNEYSVYEPVWSDHDDIIELRQHGKDAKPGIFYAGNARYNRRIGLYGMFDYNRTFNDDHELNASLLGYTTTYDVIDNLQGTRSYTAGLRLGYAFQQKYLVDFSTGYVISNKLPAGNRGAFSPSLGVAWLISGEDFMESTSAVNYLKLRLSAGILNTDEGITSHFLHINRYENSGSFGWYEGGSGYYRSGTVVMHAANPKMGFEKYKDLNFGVDGQFFNNHLWFTANGFIKSNHDLLTKPTTIYPNFYNPFVPYENFGENIYRGFELGLSYKEKLGDFRFEVGGNLLYTTSEIKKRDEIWDDAYRYRAGTSLTARWGLVADGFFMDQADIDNYHTQSFGAVKPGDIKYIDQNGDGIINENDERMIGNWMAPWSYGLNLKLSYNNFSFFMHGTAMMGADGYMTGDYYWIDGDKKYSEYARKRWTEDTKHTATMPRLTSVTNSNNHRSSTFWLYKDNYFTLDRAQLTYALPSRVVDNMKMKNIDLFVDGTSLFTISKYRHIRELRVGAEPYSRVFSLGVKATF